MQLMWISESTGRIKKIPITTRTILVGVTCIALFFIAIGASMNFIGFRIAIEKRPELARAMGGVITLEDQKDIEDAYRQKLMTLNEKLEAIELELSEMRKTKDRFAQLATPKVVSAEAQNYGDYPIGGPYKPISRAKDKDFFKALDASIADAISFQNLVNQSHKNWIKQYAWLDGLPSSIPVLGGYKITSTYGVRLDPYLGKLSQHDGLDFSAPIGTLILSSGNGVVYKTDFNEAYGKFIEIKHQNGFRTKYAHASEVLVQENEIVKRGEPIGRVGTTGRSTGPHLHYEVIKNGGFFNAEKTIDPNEMIVGLR